MDPVWTWDATSGSYYIPDTAENADNRANKQSTTDQKMVQQLVQAIINHVSDARRDIADHARIEDHLIKLEGDMHDILRRNLAGKQPMREQNPGTSASQSGADGQAAETSS